MPKEELFVAGVIAEVRIGDDVFAGQELLIREKIPEILYKVAVKSKEKWYNEAGYILSGRIRQAYQRSIGDVIVLNKYTVRLTLGLSNNESDNNLATRVEEGCGPFDLKPGLLAGSVYKRIPLGDTPADIRTVSINSPADSWIHPGFKGKKISDSILEFASEEFTKEIESALAAAKKDQR